MILNTGDVPNLYPPDEKAEIIEKMQVVARTQVSIFLLIQSSPQFSISLHVGSEDRGHASVHVQLLY